MSGLERNPVIGFRADLHGSGGAFILTDGTELLCGSSLADEVLREIRLASDDSQYRCRDMRHLVMVIKADLIEGIILRIDRFRRSIAAWRRRAAR